MPFFDALDVADPQQLIEMLNALYASEVIAEQQYYRHAVDVTGIWSVSVAAMFEEHAKQEAGHAKRLRNHIMHLGGTITNRLTTILRIAPHTSGDGDIQATPGEIKGSTMAMLRLDERAEDDAVAAYTEAILKIRAAQCSPATEVVLQKILLEELEHRHDLRNLLAPG